MERDLIKNGISTLLQGLIAFAVAYGLTGSAPVATSIAVLAAMLNSFVGLLHDRLWSYFAPHRGRVSAVR